jgi:hypothetical protein
MTRTTTSGLSYRWQRNETPLSVAPLTINAESLSHIIFPSDLTGSNGPEFFPLDLDFLIAAPSGSELVRVPLQFERRLLTTNVVDMWGFDSTKTLETHVRARRDGSFTLSFRSAFDRIYASQAQFILRIVELIKPPNIIALTMHGSAPDSMSSIGTAVAATPPEGLIGYIAALVILEEHIGESILVPEGETNTESLRELDVARQLITGETVPGQWSQAEIEMTAGEARELLVIAKSEEPVAVEITRSWTVHVGEDRQYTVSPVAALHRSVRVIESPAHLDNLPDETKVTIRLVPADEERVVELTLRTPLRTAPAPEAIFNDDPVTWVPPAFFDELLASLDAPDEPMPQLARAVARLRDIKNSR